MCGRYTLRDVGALATEITDLRVRIANLRARYNVAPSQVVPIVRIDPAGERELVEARWGLIPSWAKDEKIGYKMINARSETIRDKPSYRTPFKRRRCLVPADGFYEWMKHGTAKRPHFIHRKDDRPFFFAGLWERWETPDACIDSCTILTTSPNPLMEPIHDRMPVILDVQGRDRWLDPTADPDELYVLLKPADPDAFEAFEVSPVVNSPKNDTEACILAV
jgi:putative SOS response-associated peptidase YedK